MNIWIESAERFQKIFQPQNGIGFGKIGERWDSRKTDSSISQAGKNAVLIPGDLTFDSDVARLIMTYLTATIKDSVPKLMLQTVFAR